jgi:RNA polymerase sigma-70 factor, ECF subfamily
MNSRIATTIPRGRTHRGHLSGSGRGAHGPAGVRLASPNRATKCPTEQCGPIDVDGGLACAAVPQLEMDDRDGARVRMLYAQHGAELWRFAHRLTGDRARADDVVQETLLRAWQHPEVFNDSERSPRSWLFTVARNMVIDERRSARFRCEVSTPDGVGALDGECPDGVNAALDRLLIGDALARLTPEHRAVVRRSYFQGWTTAQIAADLRISDGTVKSRLHYALRALRLVLGEMGFTP